MSRDFYFFKWKDTLRKLKELIEVDVHYQEIKAHDATLPEAVHRLTAILGRYVLMYNDAIDCSQQNLQVQKTESINFVVKAIVSRILELKRELEKLEGSRFQFIGYGLIEVHHTISDIEITAIPVEKRRPENIQTQFEHILAKVKKEKEEKLKAVEIKEEAEVQEIPENPFDRDHYMRDTHKKKESKDIEVPEEICKTREYLAMIMAHEKTRQVIKAAKASTLKREMWEKELKGTLKPLARYELRNRSANLIQTVFRKYFNIKRERIQNCKRDELLGINLCNTPNIDKQRQLAKEMLNNRSKLYPKYEKEWVKQKVELKEEYLKYNRLKLCEEFREQLRDWFLEWFETIQFIHDIPLVGSTAIFKSELPSPLDWLDENKALMLQKEANKKKSPQDIKFEKMEAKRQERLLKKEEQMRVKAEAMLLKKMMKNPTMHPGYHYPMSKHIGHLILAIDNYHKTWDMYDVWETKDAKEKYAHRVDVENAILEANLEVLPEVDEQMRQEYHQLKQALREDYRANEIEMQIDLTKPLKPYKKPKKIKTELSQRVAEKIENLILNHFIIEYPKIRIEDFIGDANFGGEDLRTQIVPAFPFNFEIRAYWWERCREVTHGFHRILLVGPHISGKTVLVRALASINDAVLFVIDPHKIQGGLQSPPFLKRLLNNLVTCAKALQPAVIHIRYIHKLFYTKVPPEESEMNLPLISKFLVQKLMKKINKTDKITVIATGTDPWLAKSSTLLKQFPVVLLLPDCTYSLAVQILKEWVIKYNVIPADFNVSSLAQALQGYSFGYLKYALEKFMSADRIVKIAAFGLTPMEVFNYILDDETEEKVEYDKYLKWYVEKTPPGQKAMQYLQDQRDFKAEKEKYAAKKKKKLKSAPSSTTASGTGL